MNMFCFALAPENQIIGLVVFAVVCAVIGLLLIRYVSTPKQILQKWAEKQGMAVQKIERRRWLHRGPFSVWFGQTTTAQHVYRITVQDAHGHVRKGYARIGGFLGLGDYVKIAWDD
jgi:hypothetical protein